MSKKNLVEIRKGDNSALRDKYYLFINGSSVAEVDARDNSLSVEIDNFEILRQILPITFFEIPEEVALLRIDVPLDLPDSANFISITTPILRMPYQNEDEERNFYIHFSFQYDLVQWKQPYSYEELHDIFKYVSRRLGFPKTEIDIVRELDGYLRVIFKVLSLESEITGAVIQCYDNLCEIYQEVTKIINIHEESSSTHRQQKTVKNEDEVDVPVPIIEVREVPSPISAHKYQLFIADEPIAETDVKIPLSRNVLNSWGITILNKKIGERLMDYSFSDFPVNFEYLQFQYKFDGLPLLDHIWISPASGLRPYEISFVHSANLSKWRKPYSVADYLDELTKLVNQSENLNAELDVYGAPGDFEGFAVSFIVQSPQLSISTEFAAYYKILRYFHGQIIFTLIPHSYSDFTPFDDEDDLKTAGVNQRRIEFMRIYITHERLWEGEIDSLLNLFSDYLKKIEGKTVSLDQRRTQNGRIYAFYSYDQSISKDQLPDLFNGFTEFLQASIYDTRRAADLIRNTTIPKEKLASLINTFAKKTQRVLLDIEHEKESRMLAIRHELESTLLDSQLAKEEANSILQVDSSEGQIVNPMDMINLPAQIGTVIQSQTIHINNPQIKSIIAREVNGNINYTEQDERIIEIINQHSSGHEALELKSALDELKDEEVSHSERKNACRKIQGFLAKHSEAIGKTALTVLEKYLEYKLTVK